MVDSNGRHSLQTTLKRKKSGKHAFIREFLRQLQEGRMQGLVGEIDIIFVGNGIDDICTKIDFFLSLIHI